MHIGCPYCEASMGFYEQLRQSLGSEGQRHMVAMFSDFSVKAAKEFLTKPLRDVDIVTSVDLSKIGVVGTPTLMIVDNDGILRNIWRGELSEALEKDVLSAIEKPEQETPRAN